MMHMKYLNNIIQFLSYSKWEKKSNNYWNWKKINFFLKLNIINSFKNSKKIRSIIKNYFKINLNKRF
jgi:hypothetical protein